MLEEKTEKFSNNAWVKGATTTPSGASSLGEAPLPPSPTDNQKTGPSGFERFANWLKEDWLIKLGALILLIGLGWLVSYAFLNNWIGPMGRISMGIILGVALLTFGWWRMNEYKHQGGIFLVVGSTAILLTIFAAREIYGFFTPTTALIMMFLSTAFVALNSVKHDSRSLAISSLLLAGIAPLLTNPTGLTDIAWFSYLFVITAGAIWVVSLTGWRILTSFSLIMIALYSTPHFSCSLNEIVLLFAYAFVGMFFIVNMLGFLKLKAKTIGPDLFTAAGSGLFLIAWILAAAQDEWKSLIMVVWALVFSVGAFMVFKITQRKGPFFVYLAVSLGLLAAATAAELQGAALTIAYTIESGLVSILAYQVLRNVDIVKKTALLLIGPILLSFQSMDAYSWREGVFNEDFFVLLILAVTLLASGFFFLGEKKEGEKDSINIGAILFTIGTIFIYILIWLSTHALSFIENDTATTVSLFIFTVIGIGTYIKGKTNDVKSFRIYGGLLLFFVVGRLLLVDVWHMGLGERIFTFLLIGALLMSTAFLGRKKKEQINLNNN